MKVEITSFREYRKNTLQGFVNLTITPPGIEIRDATLHDKSGKRWIGLPAREYEDKNGQQAWAKIVAFPEDQDHRDFQAAALTAMEAFEKAKGAGNDIPF